MSMLEFEEYKGKLNTLKPALDDLQDALHLEEAKREIAELQEESAQDGFWNNVSHSQQVQQRIKQLQTKCEKYDKLCSSWDDLFTMCEMALEEDDASMLEELKAEYDTLSEKLEEMRLSTLLTGEYDSSNVILTKDEIKLGEPVTAGAVMVDGLGVGDVGSIVLRDRKHLAEDGLIIAVCTIEAGSGRVVSGPDIVSRGFVYVRESEALMDEARRLVNSTIEQCADENVREWSAIKLRVRDNLSRLLYNRTKRSPMILPIIMEV